jgi:hypothetical protein
MANRLHGVFTTGLGGFGVVQNLSIAEDGDEVLIQDEIGNTIEEQLYNDRLDATASLVYDRDSTPPARGDEVTLANCMNANHNGKYSLINFTLAEGNTEAPTYDATLRRFKDGDTPAS